MEYIIWMRFNMFEAWELFRAFFNECKRIEIFLIRVCVVLDRAERLARVVRGWSGPDLLCPDWSIW